MYKNVTEVAYSAKNDQIILRFESLSGSKKPLTNEDLVTVLKGYSRTAKIMIDTYDSEVNENASIDGKKL